MKKNILLLLCSALLCILLYYLIRVILGNAGMIHDNSDELFLYFIITNLYISLCTTIILHKLDSIGKH